MKLQIVTVFMKNPNHSYRTSVSPTASWNSIREYYIGSVLNVGNYPDEDKMDTCVGVQFESNNGTMHFGGNITRENLERFGEEMVSKYELVMGSVGNY